jgi:hypothetical protein
MAGMNSLLSQQFLALPDEPPTGWPSGETGSRMWRALRAHLDGVTMISLAREWGISRERVRSLSYQGLGEWRRLGAGE